MKATFTVLIVIMSVGELCAHPLEKVDSVLVLKSQKRLLLYQSGQVLRKFKVSIGTNPKGPKEKKDDGKTPEGTYRIDSKAPPLDTEYHRNLGINYPNASDKAKGRTGGDIKIHGLGPKYGKWGKLHRLKNWTDGCIAVTNKEVEEIYNLVPINTPIFIYP